MWGAGLYLTESSPSLVDVTISRNTATTEGGAAWLWKSDISMTNTIIAENSAAANGGLVRYWGDSGASTLTATYSDIWVNSPADTDSFGFTAGASGNIAADPAFVSTSDFHLRSSSRLIGAGSPLLIDPDGSISDIGALGPDGSGW